MIISVNGQPHRLFFQHEEVPSRYKRATADQKVQRTVCRLELKADGLLTPEGRQVWLPVAEGVAYRNHADIPRKADGVKHAFAAMMEALAKTGFTNYSGSVRGEIAKQFLASRPKQKTTKELKRTIRDLQEQIARLTARVKGLED